MQLALSFSAGTPWLVGFRAGAWERVRAVVLREYPWVDAWLVRKGQEVCLERADAAEIEAAGGVLEWR